MENISKYATCIKASAKIVNSSWQTQSGYKGHKYTVSIVGVYSRNLQFAVDGTQSGTISGLQKGGKYPSVILMEKTVSNI